MKRSFKASVLSRLEASLNTRRPQMPKYPSLMQNSSKRSRRSKNCKTESTN